VTAPIDWDDDPEPTTQQPGPIGCARHYATQREQRPARHTVDTITSDALDQLYARIETLEHVAAGNKRHVQLIVPDLEAALARAEQAEAALARVRAELDAINRDAERLDPDCADFQAGYGDASARVRAALDEPKEPRTAAAPIHQGGNAENCPACDDPNPDYPFLCPGLPSEEPYDTCRCTSNHAGLTLCARCPGGTTNEEK
jgi:hypothetical protein